MQLTYEERKALLDLVANRCEDVQLFVDEGEPAAAELAFWQALEQKLIAE